MQTYRLSCDNSDRYIVLNEIRDFSHYNRNYLVNEYTNIRIYIKKKEGKKKYIYIYTYIYIYNSGTDSSPREKEMPNVARFDPIFTDSI